MCRSCNRTIDAIIAKEYGLRSEEYPDETNFFQKLIIKDHRKSIWYSKHCPSSGKKITVHTDSHDVQNS